MFSSCEVSEIKLFEHIRRWLALDPLIEAAYRQAMQFYTWNGQPSLVALKEYQECVQFLERELGVPPLETTTALYEAIKERRLAQCAPQIDHNPASNIAPPSTKQAVASGLKLVGRKPQMQELETAIQSSPQRQRGSLAVVEGRPGGATILRLTTSYFIF